MKMISECILIEALERVCCSSLILKVRKYRIVWGPNMLQYTTLARNGCRQYPKAGYRNLILMK